MSEKFPSQVSTTDLAKLLGVTVARISQLCAQGILQRTGRGTFEICSAVQNYISYKVRTASAVSAPDYAAARLELMRERAKLARLERLEREQAVVPAGDVSEAGLAWAGVIRDRFLAVPVRGAAKWGLCRTAVEAQAMLRAEVNDVLNELSSMPVIFGGDRKFDESTEVEDGSEARSRD